MERLDRAVANLEWCDMWRDASVEVNGCCSSDHLLLLLILNAKRACSRNKWRPFWYEAGWSKNGDFKKIIKEVWVEKSPERDPWRGFNGKIRRCKKVIKMWVRKTKPLTEKYIQEKTAILAKIQEAADPLNMQLERA